MKLKKKILRTLVAAGLCLSLHAVADASAFRVGDEGKYIAEIQQALFGLGYDVDVDGNFGPATEAAVIEFQISRGLVADGAVGPEVYEALFGRKFPVVSRGENQIARRVVNNAMKYMGVPYVYGGASPSGFDCSGFVYYLFGQAGISLPRTADVQAEVGTPVEKSQLRAGDLVFFSGNGYDISHVGIYLRDGDFIHASTTYGIAIDSLYRDYRVTHYAGARRIV